MSGMNYLNFLIRQAALPLAGVMMIFAFSCRLGPKAATIEPSPAEFLAQEVLFRSPDGTPLVGQIDWPPDQPNPPLIFLIHHAGPVDRTAYQYLTDRLVPAGWAVFRFDKRGTGGSEGVYGCCEAEDALAAFTAAVAGQHHDPDRVYIVAQSVGSQILATHYQDFAQIRAPAGVLLLSNLLEGEAVLSIRAPLHIVVSDSEEHLPARSRQAAHLHQAAYDYGASFFIAPHTEHTLFDISDGPIDWDDPNWPARFSEPAWLSMLNWLEQQNEKGIDE